MEYSRREHDGRECLCVCGDGDGDGDGGGRGGGEAQPAGSSAGVSQSPCQEPTGPIREELGPHPCMQIRAEVEGVCRGSCHGRRSAHALIT